MSEEPSRGRAGEESLDDGLSSRSSCKISVQKISDVYYRFSRKSLLGQLPLSTKLITESVTN